MENLFNECRMLYRLDLSNWDTRQVTNMRQMFANCDYAVELLVANWNVSAVEFMDGMFQGDGALESIGRDPATFGHGDTSDMYDGCGKLFES
jgi:surface protein